jgi:hypothetical protein
MSIERKIRKIIKETLLVEARRALRDLSAFKEVELETQEGETNLFDAINEEFMSINPQHDLNNPKSAGRFFVDVLYDCMNEITEEIKKGSAGEDIPDMVMTTCNRIAFLFKNKETTSKTVQSGENFKDYILNFMNNYHKISYPGTTTVCEKLKFVFDALNAKAHFSSMNSITESKNEIKSNRETLYLFGKDAIVEGYKVVAPLTTRSSIFWARTNWLGEDIVLPEQDDISWCTARIKGGNMFNYYSEAGTTLFYFLPEGDIKGKNKFCIGIKKVRHQKSDIPDEIKMHHMVLSRKISEEDFEVWKYEKIKENPDLAKGIFEYDLLVGGHTTVDFKNRPILPSSDLNSLLKPEVRSEIKKKLKIKSDSIIDKLQQEMEKRNYIDDTASLTTIDTEHFQSMIKSLNLDVNEDDFYDKYDDDDEAEKAYVQHMEQNEDIVSQINKIIEASYSQLFEKKGFKIDQNVMKIIDKNYAEWKKKEKNVGDFETFFSLYVPMQFRQNKEDFFKFCASLLKISLRDGFNGWNNEGDFKGKQVLLDKVYKVFQGFAPSSIDRLEFAAIVFCFTAIQCCKYQTSSHSILSLMKSKKSIDIINNYSDEDIDKIIEIIRSFISKNGLNLQFSEANPSNKKHAININNVLEEIKNDRSKIKENYKKNSVKNIVITERRLRNIIRSMIYDY